VNKYDDLHHLGSGYDLHKRFSCSRCVLDLGFSLESHFLLIKHQVWLIALNAGSRPEFQVAPANATEPISSSRPMCASEQILNSG
jgi:hypothetical protein